MEFGLQVAELHSLKAEHHTCFHNFVASQRDMKAPRYSVWVTTHRPQRL